MNNLQMTPAETEVLRSDLLRLLDTFIEKYSEENHIENIWRAPLIGFADAKSPYILSLRKLISPTHYMPEDILPGARTVLCYFLPFDKRIAEENTDGDEPSASWIHAYTVTNTMFLSANAHICSHIEKLGFRAASPAGIGGIVPNKLYSNWSQRHLAYAAGLGTFGLNNMLITEKGCCGRYASVITTLPAYPDEPMKQELCLYKRNGSCGLCAARCPVGALSPARPFAREKCGAQTDRFEKLYGEDVCGKCVVGKPCTFCAP